MTHYINIHTHNSGLNSIENIFPKDAKAKLAQYPHQLFSLGLHPWFVGENFEEELHLVEEYSQHKQILAIGEIGLDKVCKTPFDIQKKVFLQQLNIAQKAQKTVIIHCVKAFDETLEAKKRAKTSQAWILHGFRGGTEQAQQLVAQGFYLSFGTQFSKEALLQTPLERLFLETDEACVSIENHYRKIAENLNMSEKMLCRQIAENFERVFEKTLH